MNAYDASGGLFVRGLTDLKTQLAKAEEHAAENGSGKAWLDARLIGNDAQAAAEGPGVISTARLFLTTLGRGSSPMLKAFSEAGAEVSSLSRALEACADEPE